MWYIHISKCQNNFLQKSVEGPPHYFPSVVFTIMLCVMGGGAQVESSTFENNVRCYSRSVCAVLRS